MYVGIPWTLDHVRSMYQKCTGMQQPAHVNNIHTEVAEVDLTGSLRQKNVIEYAGLLDQVSNREFLKVTIFF